MSLIEVATPKSASSKDKGDLLEKLTVEFLKTQNYVVAEEVRVTANELDLLCRHSVNNRQIYVECKAHRDNLSSNVLTIAKLHRNMEFWLEIEDTVVVQRA
ncbi:MAG: hypothetical protein WBO24_16000 [Nitrospirales bacterium]